MSIETFTQTSDLPYDRHTYKIVFDDGRSLSFESWEEAQAYWFMRKNLGNLIAIEVVDPPAKKTTGGGFG